MTHNLAALRPLTAAALVRAHVAVRGSDVPAAPGITWIWAANGLYKRGVSATHDLCIAVAPAPLVAGLPLDPWQPHVRWPGLPSIIPGGLLDPLLAHARRQQQFIGGERRAIEQQYFIAYDAALPATPYRLLLPGQEATAGRVRYLRPPGRLLIDIHSHHGMPAFFSATDDADDTGLSISVVIGTLFTAPTICCRLNVYGHHQPIAAHALFTHLGSFREVRCNH